MLRLNKKYIESVLLNIQPIRVLLNVDTQEMADMLSINIMTYLLLEKKEIEIWKDSELKIPFDYVPSILYNIITTVVNYDEIIINDLNKYIKNKDIEGITRIIKDLNNIYKMMMRVLENQFTSENQEKSLMIIKNNSELFNILNSLKVYSFIDSPFSIDTITLQQSARNILDYRNMILSDILSIGYLDNIRKFNSNLIIDNDMKKEYLFDQILITNKKDYVNIISIKGKKAEE